MTAKAEETKARIVDAALQLFRDKGFDETTMRDIAEKAGVATGAAYYYFRSKEDLVMAFYMRTADEARELLPVQLAKSTDLRKRIGTVIDLKLSQFSQHRRLLIALVRIGIDPKHPLSPFGKETTAMRDESIDAFRQAAGDVKIPELPQLLWLYMMGIILYWIYDESPGQKKTATLLDGTLDIIVRLIRLSALPLMGPLRRRLLKTLREVTI